MKPSTPVPGTFRNNQFLSALPASVAEELIAHAKFVRLPVGTCLFERESPLRFVYLLTSGMASVTYLSESGDALELSLLGAEGVVGWLLLLGPLRPLGHCVMRVEGEGYRIPMSAMQHAFNTSEIVRRRLLEMAQLKTMASYQNIICGRMHSTVHRLAMLLLMIADRVNTHEFSLTHDALGIMLGTRRVTITLEAGKLQKKQLIELERNCVRILDRPELEKIACPCYGILRRHELSLYPVALPAEFEPA